MLFIISLSYHPFYLIHNTSWHTLRRQLSGQVRVTAVFQQPGGQTLHVRKATRPEGQHLAIFHALGIERQPGGVRKFIH